jgi:hypothetical protein
MRRTTAGLIAGVTLTAGMAIAPATSQAGASTYQPPKIAWVHSAFTHGATATVQSKYRCFGGNENTHLWVSLKQGRKISAMSLSELANAEGTSQIARAWYDNNVPEGRQDNALNCDGTWNIQTYTLAREKGHLRKGKAYLQFCLFDSTANPNPEEDPGPGFVYEYKFVKVRR